MKRSEALREIPEAVGVRNVQAPWWEAVVKYFEDRVGVKWDPEEEPLPEEISYEVGGQWGEGAIIGGDAYIAHTCPQGASDTNPQRVAVEVVRRYNAFPRIAALFARLYAPTTSPRENGEIRDEIERILDGKEE